MSRLGLLALVAVGCSSPVAGGRADGPAVFAAACATCHGPTGQPPASMAAALGVRDLTSAEFLARRTPALIEAQVRHGSANQKMPSFAGAMTEDQIRAVAAFVMTLGTPTH